MLRHRKEREPSASFNIMKAMVLWLAVRLIVWHNKHVPITDQIRNKLSQLPHKPGVYLMKDRFGTVIYVGKARDLRRRVSQYFHPSRRMGWDLKFNALVEAIRDVDVHLVRSEAEAVLL